MPDQTWKKKILHGTRVQGARIPYKMPLFDNQNVAIGLARSNLKKKKLHGTRVHGARVPYKTPL